MDERGKKMLEGLREYFENTSPEQLKRDWEELEPYNHFGPKMDECIEYGRRYCLREMHEMNDPLFTDKCKIVEKIIGDAFEKSGIAEEARYLVEYKDDPRLGEMLSDILFRLVDDIAPIIANDAVDKVDDEES